MAKSFKKRWEGHCQDLRTALEGLRELQDEARAEYDELSERAQEGKKGERLNRYIEDTDLDALESEIDDCEKAAIDE
jgi:hypothetical protein